jgi:septal ring factor EnvC (AmiA/AmiB activator)
MRFNAIDASMLPSNSIRARLTSMLVEVQVTENPKTIQNFLEQIKGMITKLQQEQAKHQEISNKMMAQCTEEEHFRAKEIADSKDALNRGHAALAKCQASLASAEKDLPDLERALHTYVDELARATAQRENEHKSYLQRKQDYEQAIEFINAFIALVKKEIHAISFVEQSENLIRHVSRLGLLSNAVPILVALASYQEVPTTHHTYGYKNSNLVNTLNNSLNTLLHRVQADWKNNEDIEIAAVAAFNIYKARLQKAINSITNNITRTKAQIVAMTTCVKNESAVISTANAKLARNGNLLESAQKMCAQFAKEFIEATNSRLEEIQTVNEILAIIQKRFGQLPADLVSYLKSVENGWRAYENSTQFKKFVVYEQKRISDNSHGHALATKIHVF